MKLTLSTLLLSFFSFTLALFAQETSTSKFELKGIIRDQTSAVIPGLWLQFKSDKIKIDSLTDINWEFQVSLPDGAFILTTDRLSPEKFRAFINIGDKGLNPTYLEFVVDSDAIVCSGHRSMPSPKVVNSAEPPYPAVARAIHAVGDVTVSIKIKSDGSVSSVKAVSGHPLLQQAAKRAAEKFIFESSENVAEREALITFSFMPNEYEKKGVKRYKCPYRIIINAPDVVEINTADIDPAPRRNLLYRIRHFFHY